MTVPYRPLQTPIKIAIDTAKESDMEYKMGAVMVHRGRVVAASHNFGVGSLNVPDWGIAHNASMHSEMAVIEKFAVKMGLLQEIHHILGVMGSDHAFDDIDGFNASRYRQFQHLHRSSKVDAIPPEGTGRRSCSTKRCWTRGLRVKQWYRQG
jgi:hypothetical protein